MNVLKKEIKFNKRHLILLLVLNFLVLGFYYSYAVFVTKQLQENVAVLVTSGNGIDISSSSLNDSKITVNKGEKINLEVTLSNSTSNDLYYSLLHKKVPTGVIVYEGDSDNGSKGILLGNESNTIYITIENNTESDTTVEFFCQASKEEIIDKEMGYSFVNQERNFDHSGANAPVMDNLNAIPVYYEATSNTTGVWKKADQNNENKDAIWYDYDNGRWANIVLVNEDKREEYLNGVVGTTIDDSDILAHFVWIPAFRYAVVNSNNPTNYEREINVIFENNKDKLGTVSCTDSIATLENQHTYSEKCMDEINGKIYENLSTYSHPAFEDSFGFWVAKFQVSSNGTKIVPNAPSFKTTIDKAFENSRKYESVDNPYGIIGVNTQELNPDGTFNEDVNNLDTHLLTNMEWGALTILTNSLYGKSGNSMYFTDNNYTYKRVYINANNSGDYTGCSTNYSNSSNSFVTSTTSGCVRYNDLSDYTHISNGITYPIGQVGPGASTAGTIYGVYDMAGASQEMVSAFVLDETYEVKVLWNENYYDLYSTNTYVGVINDSSNIRNLYRYKLGDGIREHYRTFSDNGMWYSGFLNQSNASGYLVRGGDFESGRGASIYSSDIMPMTNNSAYRVAISY